MKIHGTSERTSGQTLPQFNLDQEGPMFGLWSIFREPAVVELSAAEGFDWVCIDRQHGHAELGDYKAIFEAAHNFGVPAGVRVPSHVVGHIGRAMDAGARLIIVPTVENGEQAKTLVQACRYAPRGKRSYGPTRTIPRYPGDVVGAVETDPKVALMVESAKGYENLDEILAAGPDAVFVGPYDLAISHGWSLEELTTGDKQHVLRDIAARCTAAGVVPGLYAGDLSLAKAMVDIGFKFMPIATDGALLTTAAQSLLSAR